MARPLIKGQQRWASNPERVKELQALGSTKKIARHLTKTLFPCEPNCRLCKKVHAMSDEELYYRLGKYLHR